MRTSLRVAVASIIVAAPLLVTAAPSSAAPSSSCTLPTVVAQSPVKNSAGTTVAVAQLRRETVNGGLLTKAYYRYCARIDLTQVPASPLAATITIENTVTAGSAPLTYSADGTLTYPSGGLATDTVDVKKGTVGYKVALRPAGTTPPPPTVPPSTTVCDLPQITASSEIKNAAGEVVAIAQLRREFVYRGLLQKGYYRYCTRLLATKPPTRPTIGVATVRHFPQNGSSAFIDYSAEGPLTYVAPTDPAYATAGVSSPMVDAKEGTVGYRVSLKAAPQG